MWRKQLWNVTSLEQHPYISHPQTTGKESTHLAKGQLHAESSISSKLWLSGVKHSEKSDQVIFPIPPCIKPCL